MFDIDKAIGQTNYNILMAKKDKLDNVIIYWEGYLEALEYVKEMTKEIN